MDIIMSEVCVFLADGFEEIESLTVVDLLRRSRDRDQNCFHHGTGRDLGEHGIIVKADSLFEIQIFQR